jgi:predicted secreted protein
MLRKLVAALATAAVAIFPAAAAARSVSVTASSNGKTVHLQRGDTLMVTLREVKDGGFTWRTLVAPAPAVLSTVSSRYVAPNLPPGSVGGEGKRVNRYRAAGAGRTRVRLGNYGPSRGAKPVQRFTLTVVVD